VYITVYLSMLCKYVQVQALEWLVT
jgi:hypothetical protein